MPDRPRITERHTDDRGHPIRASTDRAVIGSLSSPAVVRFHQTLALLSLGLAFFSFWVAAIALAGVHGSAMTFAIGLFAPIVGIGFLFTAWGLWSAKRSNVAMLLDHGRCGQCTYIVHGLVPESDGCIVCPECGAAWKAKSIGKPPRGHA